MNLSILIMLTFAIFINGRYLEDFDTKITSSMGTRVDGDELIHYSYRISPFFLDRNGSKYETEILYEAPDNVQQITFVIVEQIGVCIDC